jgi:hypothetical protein
MFNAIQVVSLVIRFSTMEKQLRSKGYPASADGLRDIRKGMILALRQKIVTEVEIANWRDCLKLSRTMLKW